MLKVAYINKDLELIEKKAKEQLERFRKHDKKRAYKMLFQEINKKGKVK